MPQYATYDVEKYSLYGWNGYTVAAFISIGNMVHRVQKKANK
jgi:hypothetical protein